MKIFRPPPDWPSSGSKVLTKRGAAGTCNGDPVWVKDRWRVLVYFGPGVAPGDWPEGFEQFHDCDSLSPNRQRELFPSGD